MTLRDRTKIVVFGVFTMALSAIGVFLSNSQVYARSSMVNIQESIKSQIVGKGIITREKPSFELGKSLTHIKRVSSNK